MYTNPEYQSQIASIVTKRQMVLINEVAKMIGDSAFIYAAIIGDLINAGYSELPDLTECKEIQLAGEVIAQSVFITIIQYLEKHPDQEFDLIKQLKILTAIFPIESPSGKMRLIDAYTLIFRSLARKISSHDLGDL